MFGECHAHLFMNGYDYKKAVNSHKNGPDEGIIRACLKAYADAGVSFVRDGGDAFGVSARAKSLALQYGIDYRTPVFAIHKKGCYGGIVGRGFETFAEYAALVRDARFQGADFIKIMTTGIMDFDRDGSVTGAALSAAEVKEMVHIAHAEGMAVMSHTNGDGPCRDALAAGVDSLEHGNFMEIDTIQMLADSPAVWVPTLSTVKNLLGTGRFQERTIQGILEKGKERISLAFEAGARLGLGSDAGAYGVFHGHGILDEYALFLEIVGKEKKIDSKLHESERIIKETF